MKNIVADRVDLTAHRPGGEIRVLVVHPALAPYRVDLLNRLSTLYELKVLLSNLRVSYYDAYDQESLASRLRCNYSYLATSERLGPNILEKLANLWRQLRDFRPDVIITSEFGFETISLLGLVRGRSLETSPGVVVWSAENEFTLESRGYLRRMIRQNVSRQADALLVYSAEAARAFAKRFSPTCSIHICANLQDEQSVRDRLTRASQPTATIVSKHDLEGQRIVLFVGRLVSSKNVELLLESFNTVAKRRADARLVLVGAGPLRARIVERAQALGLWEKHRVVLTGHLEGHALFAWYRLADVLVLPSLFEPYGAVINEALLAGVPVVCSTRCGGRVLIRSEHAGAVVDPADIEGMAEALETYLERGRDTTKCSKPRPSLMEVPFERDVEGVCSAIDAACETRR